MTALRGRISNPSRQGRRVARVERVQHERRQREVVDPVDLSRHVDLFLVVAVDLDQHFDAAGVRPRGEVLDERERLGNHEAAGSGLLDRKAGGIERIARMPAAQNCVRIASR